MNKSEIYKQAQICVLCAHHLGEHNTLEILRELMHQEDLALFTEKREEKEREEKEQERVAQGA